MPEVFVGYTVVLRVFCAISSVGSVADTVHGPSVVLHDANYPTNYSGIVLHYRSVALHDANYPTNCSGIVLHYRSVGLHNFPNALHNAPNALHGG
jgi:L-fucose mutarotase/ribose pyranase (RbsD/FucU family)